MDREWMRVPCAIVRGGTSKGIFFKEHEIPAAGPLRDKFILRVFGSPDQRQIDGLAGANSLTSKVAIIGPSSREDADVDYTFGQVSFAAPVIDWLGNCGNISSAVGLYAVDEGFVKPVEPFTNVRIYNTNTDKMIYATVPVKDGKGQSEGDYEIQGVPGTGARILLEFDDPAGSVTKKLLPTGNAKDIIDLGEKGKFTVSVVDAANPVVFMKAEELGLKGTELPTEVENMPEVLRTIEEVRSVVAEMVGIVDDAKLATKLSPAIPKIGFVSKARDYKNPDGKIISGKDIDLVSRLASMQKMHRAYMVTGGVCTGAAANIEGTVVRELLDEEAKKSDTLRIGHPYGVMDVKVTLDTENPDKYIKRVGVGRTARRIMEGYAYVPKTVLK
ncbi:2-methylaconitate cis-trans-isomerase PrpF [Sporomusaceae bacterium BoRhaA]|uniref:2-methylaconitate cis-trans isomerase PrpF family protein n=1 Tax=Pelorhabdus rhamnosifermentans TaxID=2772457 RepID=UPI001FEB28FE|nr:PrpF domain-containing protein [Pelorhabdus rhamnosifermentans]MBU2699639.1 2-methylaconitate cis-trans-isomerase PrpF [Pelorhabdus rhamnosifermentans]